MIFLPKLFRAGLLAIGFAVLLTPGAHAEGDGCTTLLTVTGEMTAPNRGPYDPDTDKFFGYSEVEFSKAHAFSCTSLQAMKTVSIQADFPKGRQVHTYQGVLMADILAAAGTTGKTVIIQALDGYAVEAPLEDFIAKGAVVATMRNGVPFGIGDFGPTQIVFPRAQRDDLADMPDDLWVWSIFHIRVE